MDFVPWKKRESQKLVLENNMPQFFCEILAARGFSDAQAAMDFLDTTQPLHDPFLLRDMDKATERIHRAVAEGERILIYGDYDCDGITATVMLYDYLENAGADLLYYIPTREEGYGLNLDAVRRICEGGVRLIITVDNGVSSAVEIAKAAEYGIDVIVTDHHSLPENLPDCVAIINPHRQDSDYPFRELCGAGVAFKLISALEQDEDGLMLELYGDLLAIATMADIVPLHGENRMLVREGIKVLRSNCQRPGIIALAKVSGIELSGITGEQLAFGLTPRINVTGRIDSVDMAVELLLTQDEEEAERLATHINCINTKRKEIEAAIAEDIADMLLEFPQITASRVLLFCGKGWHPGVIGITASRMAERYGKPCIVFTQMESGELRGSARSVEGFSIIEAITACGDLLTKYGGHPMAAGLSMVSENYSEFSRRMESYCAQYFPKMPRRLLPVDSDITVRDITIENIGLMDRLQPYGCENRQPTLLLRGATVTGINPVGGGNHIRLILSQGDKRTEVISFSTTPESFPIPVGTVVDCAVVLSVNTYQGNSRPSARLVAIQPAGFPMENKLCGWELYDSLRRGEDIPESHRGDGLFGREELSAVFRLLRELAPYGGGVDWLLHRLGEGFGMFRLLVGLDILTELGLITAERVKNTTVYSVVPASGKANIPDAPTYGKLAAAGLTRD